MNSGYKYGKKRCRKVSYEIKIESKKKKGKRDYKKKEWNEKTSHRKINENINEWGIRRK